MALLIQRPELHRWHAWVALWILVLLPLGGWRHLGERAWAQTPESSGALEYKVKAAYLLNFCKLVRWPAGAFPNEDSPLVVGVVGQDRFGSLLEEILGGEKLGQHPITIRRFQVDDKLDPCHLLFVSASDNVQGAGILASVKGRPVLTVGEVPGFGELGGMINFTSKEGSIRFETNPESAEHAGIKLSYKMIRLSKVVKTAPAGSP